MFASADNNRKKRGSPIRPKASRKPSSLSRRGSIGGKTVRKRPSGSRGRSSGRKELSTLLHWASTVLFAGIVGIGAYYFLILPYFYRWKPCYGSTEYDICIPHGYSIYGIDLSHHQGNIDWSAVSRLKEGEYPLGFVFIKATEGGNHKDDKYNHNIEEARSQGFVCGSYHYYNPGTSPSRQAEFFIKNVTVQKGDLPPVVDVEKKGPTKPRYSVSCWSGLIWLRSIMVYGPLYIQTINFENAIWIILSLINTISGLPTIMLRIQRKTVTGYFGNSPTEDVLMESVSKLM